MKLNTLVLCAFALLASSVAGADENPDGRLAFGVQTALAHEQSHLFGSGPSGHMTMAFLQGQIQVALLREGVSPRLQLINEAVLGQSFGPSKGLLLGLDETFRFHVRPSQRIGWYVEAGAGIGSIGFTAWNLDGWFQYLLHVGTGVRMDAGRGNIIIGYRLSHLSNNDTMKPNLGLNMHTIVVGYSRPLP